MVAAPGSARSGPRSEGREFPRQAQASTLWKAIRKEAAQAHESENLDGNRIVEDFSAIFSLGYCIFASIVLECQ
jgi:hypothetical protein